MIFKMSYLSVLPVSSCTGCEDMSQLEHTAVISWDGSPVTASNTHS
jgi:hypothetical protein